MTNKYVFFSLACGYGSIDWFAIKVKHLINREVQIYTKRGNVEIPLTGRISDFENAILLHKTNLNETNAIIQVNSQILYSKPHFLVFYLRICMIYCLLTQEAGKKKLKVMQKAAIFRRHVQCQEWKHKVLKMKIEDMNNFIKIIDKCKVWEPLQLRPVYCKIGR